MRRDFIVKVSIYGKDENEIEEKRKTLSRLAQFGVFNRIDKELH